MIIERDLIENCPAFQVGSMSNRNVQLALLAHFDIISKAMNGDIEAMVDMKKSHTHKYFDIWTFSTDKLKEFCDKIGIEFYQDPFGKNYHFRNTKGIESWGWGDKLEWALKTGKIYRH